MALVPKQKYLSCDQNSSSAVKTRDRGGRREFVKAKSGRDSTGAGRLGATGGDTGVTVEKEMSLETQLARILFPSLLSHWRRFCVLCFSMCPEYLPKQKTKNANDAFHFFLYSYLIFP